MKKLFLAMALVLFISIPVSAVVTIHTIRTHNAVEISASGNSAPTSIDMKQYNVEGYFSIQVEVTGDGTAKFEYELSNDGVTFLEPSSASDIASGILKTSGPGSDGKDLYSFSPEPARFLKIRVTETGGANSITVTVWLMME